ncbi:MAG: hypothetical protein KDA33_11925 [Phycisphaerales bacterium]|nr:hypothetical protein [Phycisphaerales bacterium]
MRDEQMNTKRINRRRMVKAALALFAMVGSIGAIACTPEQVQMLIDSLANVLPGGNANTNTNTNTNTSGNTNANDNNDDNGNDNNDDNGNDNNDDNNNSNENENENENLNG